MAEKTVKKSAPKKEKAQKKVSKSKKPKTQSLSSSETTVKKTCKIGGCKRTHYRAKGYCTVHYKKWRQGEYGKTRYRRCHETDCRKPMGISRFGYCEDHFKKFYLEGQAPAATKEKEVEKQEAGAA